MAVRAPLLALPALLTVALGAAGCGQATGTTVPDGLSGDREAAADTVKDFADAGRKGDAGKVCDDVLAPALVRQIERVSKRECSDVLDDDLGDADSTGIDVKSVTVTGTTASAVVTSEAGDRDRTDTLTLTKVGGDWRISRLGSS